MSFLPIFFFFFFFNSCCKSFWFFYFSSGMLIDKFCELNTKSEIFACFRRSYWAFSLLIMNPRFVCNSKAKVLFFMHSLFVWLVINRSSSYITNIIFLGLNLCIILVKIYGAELRPKGKHWIFIKYITEFKP